MVDGIQVLTSRQKERSIKIVRYSPTDRRKWHLKTFIRTCLVASFAGEKVIMKKRPTRVTFDIL